MTTVAVLFARTDSTITHPHFGVAPVEVFAINVAQEA